MRFNTQENVMGDNLGLDYCAHSPESRLVLGLRTGVGTLSLFLNSVGTIYSVDSCS